MGDDFSPPLETSLRKQDSNLSWTPSQGSEETMDPSPTLDTNKLFLVSLGTLMALFS
jgi:hypothetical protein